MRSDQSLSDKESSSEQGVSLPNLSIVLPATPPAAARDTVEDAAREWDPYDVWRRRIRPDTDAA